MHICSFSSSSLTCFSSLLEMTFSKAGFQKGFKLRTSDETVKSTCIFKGWCFFPFHDVQHLLIRLIIILDFHWKFLWYESFFKNKRYFSSLWQLFGKLAFLQSQMCNITFTISRKNIFAELKVSWQHSNHCKRHQFVLHSLSIICTVHFQPPSIHLAPAHTCIYYFSISFSPNSRTRTANHTFYPCNIAFVCFCVF